MKVLTLLGTRPEIIRLSQIIPRLDNVCEHVLVHTGQNYTRSLSDVFFEQMGIRIPDYSLNVRGDTFGSIVAAVLTESEKVLRAERPDAVLILGDTNSGLAAITAKRLGIPVYHMEAGNRCYDDRVPEEINRRIIDHTSDVLMPYTERSRANLIREGIAGERIYVTGNPIKEVLDHYGSFIDTSSILEQMGVERGRYFLVTLHRAENVDEPARLKAFIGSLQRLAAEYALPVLCSLHPRTRSQLDKQEQTLAGNGVIAFEPVGFFDFIKLEQHAYCVLSDSGTVQEECCLLKVPNVTLRDVTERPETLEVGSNILSGAQVESIMRAVALATSCPCTWIAPPEYLFQNVSETVVKIILSYRPNVLQRGV
jgi:UDP-N-acetylglucosamine 2-epimerase (non-hydrolysing)